MHKIMGFKQNKHDVIKYLRRTFLKYSCFAPAVFEKFIESPTEEITPGISMIHAPEIWKDSHYGKGIVIAVIDSGCDKLHPDLQDQIIDGKTSLMSEI